MPLYLGLACDQAFQDEDFLLSVELDMQELLARVQDVVREMSGLVCEAKSFVFDEYDVSDAHDRWGWSVVQFNVLARRASILVTVRQVSGHLLYDFEGDFVEISAVAIAADLDRLCSTLAEDILRQL
jgi:hypothetical protein